MRKDANNDTIMIVPKDCTGGLSKAKFIQFCADFDCKAEFKKGQWVISTDDAINFFWLGANLQFDYETGLSISKKSKALAEMAIERRNKKDADFN